MAQSEEIAIQVTNVSKDFILPHQRISSVKGLFTGLAKKRTSSKETQHALHDISFEIKKGEFFGIVGRNGSGKSTLLKILAGIYQPTQGTVATHGRLVPFIELGVGFNPELTGRENVFLNGALLGFSRKQIEAMYDDIVSFAEIEKFMDQKLKNYSSGMQVRLAFSMATRSDADILLIDEVLAVGDADFQRKCFDYFKKLKKNHKTVVFVSHDMSAVREYCDRAVMIEKSKVIDSGSANKIANRYTRMFIQEADDSNEKDKEATRWGSGAAKVGAINLSAKKLVSKDEKLSIAVDVISNEAAEGLIVGFSVKSPDGDPLLGTNTKLERVSTGAWKKDQTKRITWTMPNVYPDGLFKIDLAVVKSDGITICDWFEDAASFRSYDEKNPPYEVSPGIITQIEESHAL